MLTLLIALAAVAYFCRTWRPSVRMIAAVISMNGVSIPLGISIELPQLVIVSGLVAWALAARVRYRPFLMQTGFVFGAVFWVGYLGLSRLYAPEAPEFIPVGLSSGLNSRNISVFYMLWISLNLLTVAYILNSVTDERKLVAVIGVALKASMIVSLYTIFQFFSMTIGLASEWLIYLPNEHYLAATNLEGNRALGFSREPLYLASYLVFVIPLFVVLLISKSPVTVLPRPTLALGLVLAVVAMLLTKSTGGFVALLVSLAVVFFLYGIVYARVLLISLLALLGVLMAFGLNATYYLRRLTEVSMYLAYGQDAVLYSSYQRVHTFVEAVQTIPNYLWTGVGIGRTPFFLSWEQVHNAYLNITLETGVIGLGLFLFVLVYPLAKAALYVRKIGIRRVGSDFPWLIGLAAGLVGALVQLLSYYAYMQTMLWFFVGLLLAGLGVIKSRRLAWRIGSSPYPSPSLQGVGE